MFILFPFSPHLTGVRFLDIFQELSFPAEEAATLKMEASRAAIMRESSDLASLRFPSPAQDGRLGSGIPAFATLNMATRNHRSRCVACVKEVTHTRHFRFLSAAGAVATGLKGVRWILTFASASCR